MPLAFSEGKWLVTVLIVLVAVFAWISPVIGLVPLVLLLFVFYFYRDPQRDMAEAGLISPADGKVTKIQRIQNDYVGDAWEVSIFMSPVDVHVNRSPIQGVVDSVRHYPGKFLPAMNPQAPLVNEKRVYCIQGEFRVQVVQIAGIMARRTVNWVVGGDRVKRGERIGLIKFGSCTQIVFPGTFNILVKEGDKVKAALTTIGEES